MPRVPSKITQALLKKVLRGAAQAGIDINKVRVEIVGDGRIILMPNPAILSNDDLDQELAQFEARHGEG